MIIEDRFDVIENPNSYHIADLYSSFNKVDQEMELINSNFQKVQNLLVLIYSNQEEIFLFPYQNFSL